MTYPYLTRVRLENYKNLNGREWLALNQLNVLIGPNGAGKSNFIAGLRFLRDSITSGIDAFGREVTGLQVGLNGVGGIKLIDDILQRPSHAYLQFEFNETDAMPQGSIFELDLHAPDERPQVHIHEECLRAAQTRSGNLQPFYYYKCHDRRSGEGVVSVYNESGEGSHFEAVRDVPIDELAFNSITRLLEDSQVPPERTPVYKVRRHLRDTIVGWRFYNSNDMSFQRIRNAEPRVTETSTALAASGENLAAVIFNNSNHDVDFEDSLNAAMRSLNPDVRRVRSVPTDRLGLNVEFHMNGSSDPYTLVDVSDGMIRMLCWASILQATKLPPLIVIDEPEFGLHVNWLGILASWIKQASHRTQIIVSTHNPDFLDHFTDDADDVLWFSQEDGRFTPVRLSSEQLQQMLKPGQKLGDFYRLGV